MSQHPDAASTTLSLQFSHIGFYVRDLPGMARFYKEALRFTQTDAGDLGAVQLVFLSRDPAEHHQIVLATGRPAELPFNPINQISFRVPDIATLRRFHARLVEHGAQDVQPVTHGNAISIYCRDPEATGSSSSSTRRGTASSRCASPSTWPNRTSRSSRAQRPSRSACRSS